MRKGVPYLGNERSVDVEAIHAHEPFTALPCSPPARPSNCLRAFIDRDLINDDEKAYKEGKP